MKTTKKTAKAKLVVKPKTDVSASIRVLQEVPVTDRMMRMVLESVREGQLTNEVIREYLAESAITHVSSPSARLDAFRELLKQFGVGDESVNTLTVTILPPP